MDQFFIQIFAIVSGVINANTLPVLIILLAYYWLQHRITHYYIQKTNEYPALTYTLYELAKIRLAQHLENKNASAFLERENYQNLRPCVILDIDDTVLNSSSYTEGRWIYSSNSKRKYVKKYGNFPLIEGAKDFFEMLKKHDVELFLVTNREPDLKEFTMENLIQQGVPVKGDSFLLFPNDEPDWDKDKFKRYRKIAEEYRILLIMGDDFNDFVYVKNLPYDEYRAMFEKYKHMLGLYWIQFPNPFYGYWLKRISRVFLKK